MRFCQVTTFYPPFHYGGDALIVRALSEHLARNGHEVDVVYCRDAFEFDGFEPVEQRTQTPGLRVHELRHPLGSLSPILTHQTGRPALKRRALERIFESDFDVVHFHNISLVGGPGILQMSRAPVTLYTTHEHWLICPMHVLWKYGSRPCDKPDCLRCVIRSGRPPQFWRYSGLLNEALRHVDCLLTPSSFTAERHRQAGFETPIRVFPFFSPIQPPASEPADPPDDPLFVYTGRLEKSKGIEQLLEAFSRRPGYALKVAGSGNLEDDLRLRYRNCGNIEFLGLLSHARVKQLLRHSTACVVPSWGPEVSPLTVLEALSCGVPVVVRRSGGSAEAIERDGGGWVYERAEELLPLLDRIAADPAAVVEMGRVALRNARDNLRIEQWMERYFSLVDDIAAGREIQAGVRG